ncbi:MAG TPA: PaaI family thioesterase [Caulobacteraceae bacterium]|jgi:acyl-coenzyme A thioesterase PaaI-like protein
MADNAMGLSCGESLRASGVEISGLLTVSLCVDFTGVAKVGQWLEIRPEVIRAGKTLCFASALVMADEAVCARASAVFKPVSSAPPQVSSPPIDLPPGPA